MQIKLCDLKEKYDFIIVGTGIIGLTILQELIKKNKKNILVIESGSMHSSNPYPNSGKALFSKLPIKNTSRYYGVGGSSNTWGSISALFEKQDFEKAKNQTYLPINYEQFKYWISLCNEYGFPKINEFELPEKKSRFGKDLIKKKFVQVQPPVKFYPKSSLLESDNVHFIQNAKVNFINKYDSLNNYSIHFNFDNEKEISVIGTKTVICAGTIETVKILLKSGLKKDLPLLGNYFMNHPKGFIKSIKIKNIASLISFLPTENHNRRKYIGLLLNKSLSSDNFSHYVRFERGYINPRLNKFIRLYNDIYSFEKNFIKKIIIRLILFFASRLQKIIIHFSKNRFISLELFAEISLKKSNRISLTKNNQAQVDYQFDDQEIENIKKLLFALEKKLNLKKGELSIKKKKLVKLISIDSSHHLGGAICGDNKDSSVVDKSLKVHNTNNIFLCSGAVFPFGGAVNPTLTFVALSLWFSNTILTQDER